MPAGDSKHSNSKAECLAEADKEDEGNETKLSAVEEAWDAAQCARTRSPSRKLLNSRTCGFDYDPCASAQADCLLGTTPPAGVSAEYYCDRCRLYCGAGALCAGGFMNP